MTRVFTATVIGDLNIELVCQLNDSTFADFTHDTLLYRTIGTSIGGTAANFALAGLNYYRELHVLGKVGNDVFGMMVMNQLTSASIHVHCNIDNTVPTGLAIHLRDSNPAHHKGIRLLVVQEKAANHMLSVQDVEQHIPIIAQSDVLLLDGYCLLAQPRRDASIRAMQIAQAYNTVVAFDIVPHHPYELYSFDTLKSIIDLSTIIITELYTIRHFLQMEEQDQTEEKELAIQTAVALHTQFPGKVFLLRFGIGNIDQSLICLPGKAPQHSFTGYNQAEELRGFGDRLTARELADILPLLKEATHGEGQH